jgi:hypothetical protein
MLSAWFVQELNFRQVEWQHNIISQLDIDLFTTFPEKKNVQPSWTLPYLRSLLFICSLFICFSGNYLFPKNWLCLNMSESTLDLLHMSQIIFPSSARARPGPILVLREAPGKSGHTYCQICGLKLATRISGWFWLSTLKTKNYRGIILMDIIPNSHISHWLLGIFVFLKSSYAGIIFYYSEVCWRGYTGIPLRHPSYLSKIFQCGTIWFNIGRFASIPTWPV